MRLKVLILAAVLAAAWHGQAFATNTGHLGVGPRALVTLQWMCNVGTPTRLRANGSQAPDFEIPTGFALVITDLEFRVTTSSENIGKNYIVELHLVPATGPTSYPYLGFMRLVQYRGYLRDHLTAGLVVDWRVALDNDLSAPDPQLTIFGVAPGDPAGVPNCNAILRGYLVRLR
jgi:hypothetical protein